MDKILAEIEAHAAKMRAALRKLPEGPHRANALSQVDEVVRLARARADQEASG